MPGELAETSPVDLCLHLAGEGATGTLAITAPRGDAVLVFSGGRLAGARPPSGGRRARLGERLVSVGRLDRPDLEAVLAEQSAAADAPALGQMLIERGLASTDAVRLFVQEQILETLLETITWRDGSWDFQAATAAVDVAVDVSMPVDRALMEVRRRAAERDRLAAVVPSAVSVPTVVAGAPRPASLPTDAFTVFAAVDGTRTVGDIAEALGAAHDETRRQLYRLTLQGLVTFADTVTTTSMSPDPTPEAPLHASPATDHPAVHLTDDGWAARRADAAASVDEPEPWVGWAHGADDEPPDDQPSIPDTASAAPTTSPWEATPTTRTTDPAASLPEAAPVPRPTPSGLWEAAEAARAAQSLPVEDRPAPPPAQPPAAAPPAAAPTPSPPRALDADTRRALFSELHEVGRASPSVRPADPAVEATTTSPPAERHEPAPSGPPTDPVAPPPPAADPAPSLSRSDVSELLRELHALNLDDDR